MVCGLDHLKKRSDFLRVARKGLSRATPGLVLQVCGHDDTAESRPVGHERRGQPGSRVRVGVTVTRKVGNAVTRNRVRRRLRAVARAVLSTGAPAGFDYVLIGRPATVDRPFLALIADLEAALRGLGKTPTPVGGRQPPARPSSRD
ncbi:MAG: ribonuclease P protein component [Rhodospirillales bacterium]|nr:ribonuclease P protein component [Rhodospirillales bacterium]